MISDVDGANSQYELKFLSTQEEMEVEQHQEDVSKAVLNDMDSFYEAADEGLEPSLIAELMAISLTSPEEAGELLRRYTLKEMTVYAQGLVDNDNTCHLDSEDNVYEMGKAGALEYFED